MGNNKFAATFYLFGRLGIANDKDARHEIVLSATNGRTENLADLTQIELHELNEHLKRLSGNSVQFDEQKLKRQIKKFFSLCHTIGWEHESGKLNYETINAWLLKFGYLHKGINDYTVKELPKLITQLENIKRGDYEKNKN